MQFKLKLESIAGMKSNSDDTPSSAALIITKAAITVLGALGVYIGDLVSGWRRSNKMDTVTVKSVIRH